MKRCVKCKETKPHDAFYKNSSRPDGLQSLCKDCQRIETRLRMRKPEVKERIRVRTATLKAEQPELFKERRALAGRNFYRKHKDKLQAWQDKHYQRMRDGLTDQYVSGLIATATGLSRPDVPEDLIKAKRAQLKLGRLIKEMK